MRIPILLTCQAALLACAAPRATVVPDLQCFKPDSGRLTYGSIATDSETGDQSGVRFSFAIVAGHLQGWVQDARGELPPERQLDSLTTTVRGDSLVLSYLSGSTRYSYRLSVTCDRLEGTAYLFQTPTNPGVRTEVVFDRVPDTKAQ